MKFSFDEGARREIVGFWEEALGEASAKTNTLIEELVEIYREQQYMPLWKMTDKVATYYSEDFKLNLLEQFDRWTESDTSITAFAQELEASDDSNDDAYNAAYTLQEDMKAVLEEIFKNITEVPKESTEAHLSKNVEEIFDDIRNLVNDYEGKITDLIETYESEADKKSEENQLYLNVSEILGAVFGAYLSLLMVFNDGVDNIAEHISERGKGAVNKSEEDRKIMRDEASSAAESLRDVSGLFDFE